MENNEYFNTAGGSLTSIDNAIKKLEEVKKYLDSNTLVVDDNFNCLSGMLEEVERIIEEMASIRTTILKSSSLMKRCYDSFYGGEN